MKLTNETTLGKLRAGDRFRFDRARMSAPRASNRPTCDCVKLEKSLVARLAYYRRADSKQLFYADTQDAVIKL